MPETEFIKQIEGIDAHQHFWNFDPVRDSWITEDMSVIRRDFGPADLLSLLEANSLEGSVIVQSDQSEEENIFQLENAEKFDFIKGVVGWVDLRAKDLHERLAYYRQFEKLKGFRHVLQGETDRALMLTPDFKKGIGALKSFGYTYDILIHPDQLRYVPELAAAFPDQPFVIDHIAKPSIRDGQPMEEWKMGMKAAAAHGNVHCKISGMVTETNWKNWKKEDFRPYLDTVVAAFGTRRILFGSDWPVCLVAGSYSQMIHIVRDYFAGFSQSEQTAFFGGNATTFYNL